MVAAFQAGPTMDALPPPTGMPDTAPVQAKRRGRPPKDPNAPTVARKPRGGNLEAQIGASLVMLNMGMMIVPPLRGDALDAAEIEALAKAIDAQAKQSPQFRKYLTAFLSVTSGGQLIGVLGIIGARRMARHNFLLPIEADAQLGSMIGSVKITQPDESEPRTFRGTPLDGPE